MVLRDIVNEVAKAAEEEFTFRILEKGEKIPGFEVIMEEGSRTWKHKDEKEMIKEVLSYYPSLDGKLTTMIPAKEKFITVTQFEKLAGKGKADAFTVKPISKRVVLVDNKRQELADAFTNYRKDIDDLI